MFPPSNKHHATPPNSCSRRDQWSFNCTKSKLCASVGHHLIWAMPILSSWLEVESRLQLMADKTTLYVSSPTCKNMPTKHETRYHEPSTHILEHYIQRARWCAKSMLSSTSKPVPLCCFLRFEDFVNFTPAELQARWVGCQVWGYAQWALGHFVANILISGCSRVISYTTLSNLQFSGY